MSAEKRFIIKDDGTNGWEHKRVCSCGDVKWVKYPPRKDTQCAACSRLESIERVLKDRKDNPKELVRYTRVCPDCGDVRDDLTYKPFKGSFCNKCSKKQKNKASVTKVDIVATVDSPLRTSIVLDNGRTKYLWLRICSVEKCRDAKYITYVPRGGVLCGSCATLKKAALKKAASKKLPVKKPKKSISKEAIVKIREINRKHKEESVKKVIPQTLSDAEMIKAFEKDNTVKVFDSPKLCDLSQGMVLCHDRSFF